MAGLGGGLPPPPSLSGPPCDDAPRAGLLTALACKPMSQVVVPAACVDDASVPSHATAGALGTCGGPVRPTLSCDDTVEGAPGAFTVHDPTAGASHALALVDDRLPPAPP